MVFFFNIGPALLCNCTIIDPNSTLRKPPNTSERGQENAYIINKPEITLLLKLSFQIIEIIEII